MSNNLPAKYFLAKVVIKNTTSNAVTINMGSSALGTDIANAFAVTASADALAVPLGKDLFSTASAQALYISSASWSSANLTIYLTFQRFAT